MTTCVFIDGAVGTTGLEIAERLALRREFVLVTLDETQRKQDSARAEAINDADVVILCLPDDAARAAAAMVANDRTRMIDASTAHRVAPGWTYGFPELIGRDAVAAARRVSNPGCYPTGFLALIAPLVRSGLLSPDWPYTVNAVSGFSGGGKAMIARFEAEPEIAFRAYGLGLDHKHLAEMQQFAGLKHVPLFAPAVIGAYRGMVVEVPLPLAAMSSWGPGAGTPDQLRASLTQFYHDAPLVRVHQENPDELLLRGAAQAWDGLNLYVCAAADGSQARLIAVLDNLGKGASGAAVQTLNLMAGLDETVGLRL